MKMCTFNVNVFLQKKKSRGKFLRPSYLEGLRRPSLAPLGDPALYASSASLGTFGPTILRPRHRAGLTDICQVA